VTETAEQKYQSWRRMERDTAGGILPGGNEGGSIEALWECVQCSTADPHIPPADKPPGQVPGGDGSGLPVRKMDLWMGRDIPQGRVVNGRWERWQDAEVKHVPDRVPGRPPSFPAYSRDAVSSLDTGMVMSSWSNR